MFLWHTLYELVPLPRTPYSLSHPLILPESAWVVPLLIDLSGFFMVGWDIPFSIPPEHFFLIIALSHYRFITYTNSALLANLQHVLFIYLSTHNPQHRNDIL